jgi:hypothetical protein
MDMWGHCYPKARTGKHCFGCRRWIQPGEYYERYTCADGGRVYDVVLCFRCVWCSQNLSAGDYFVEGDFEDHVEMPTDWRERFDAMAQDHARRRREARTRRREAHTTYDGQE